MEESLSEKSKVLERLEDKRIGENVISSDPKVSIIIPAYNVSKFIGETLESVFAQTFKDYEVVVINDGSKDTDELEALLENYYDKIIYGRQENLGASEARNAAICLSRGKLLAFLDGDDIWFPNCLEQQVKFLEQNNLDMVYCDAELFGDKYSIGKTYMQTTPSNGEVNTISLIAATCNVITSGTMLKKENLYESGLFDTRAKTAQDFDLWFRLAKYEAKIGYQRNCLIKYRVSSIGLSGSNLNRADRTVEILEFIKSKYDFTAEEQEVWQNQLALSKADRELEKGKFNLVKGNYAEARRHIAKANEYHRKPKLSLIKIMITISPSISMKLFKKFRPNEFDFIF